MVLAVSNVFAANMALTIEPAAYVSDHPLIPPRFRNMGVRIEDDVLITDGALELQQSAAKDGPADREPHCLCE